MSLLRTFALLLSAAISSVVAQAVVTPCVATTSGVVSLCESIPASLTPAAVQTYTAASDLTLYGNPSSLLVGTATLTPGGPAYTDGSNTVSLGPSGVLSIDGTTTTLPTPSNELQTFTLGNGLTASGDTSSLVIGTATLTVGGPAYTSGSDTVSLGPSGVLSVDGTTTMLGTPAAAARETYTLGDGLTATGDSSSLVIGSTTLTPGAVYTISSHTVSLGTSGVVAVDGSSTTLPTNEPISTPAGELPLQTYTLLPDLILTGNPTAIIVDSTTLTPGAPPLTIGTDTISLGSSGLLSFDGSTTTLPASSPEVSASASPTSTITTIPSGISFITLSGTQPTTNELVTTTDQSSSTTVVPLIVPCLTCAGIEIWGPVPTGVDIEWPDHPELPEFEVPCIINCDSPPINKGQPPSPQSNPDPGPTPNPDPTPNQSPDPTQDPTPSQEPSASASETPSGIETTIIEIVQISLQPTLRRRKPRNPEFTTGLTTVTTSTTVTGSSESDDFTIPTPAYDDFATPVPVLQAILSIVSVGTSSEDSVDSTSNGVTSTSISLPPASDCTLTSQPYTVYDSPYVTTDGQGSIVTSTLSITLTATTACACANGLGAGINNSVGSDGLTRQVCALGTSTTVVVGTITPSSTPPPTSATPTSSSAASPSPSYDPNSQACKECGSDLGASSCAASDGQCLVDQCKADTSCQACGIDCSIYA